MSNVSIKIKQLITEYSIFTVGAVPEGLNDPVEKIRYHGANKPYNGGNQIEGPCYVVFFVESNARKIIPVSKVIEVGIEKEEEEPMNKKSPEEVGLKAGAATTSQGD
ncbi:MAG: hypothetical protein ACOCSL_00925 [Thermoplasmatota archaeon]